MRSWGKMLTVCLLTAVAGLAASASPQVGTTTSPGQNGTVAVAVSPDLEAERLRQLEQEASMKAKEQELQKLSADLDRRLKDLEELKKQLEAAEAKRRNDDEAKTRKLLAVYRGLKPEEAAKHLNKLDADLTIAILNRLDKKTLVRLIPFLTEPRVIRWTVENFVVEEEAGEDPATLEEESQPVNAAQVAGEP